MADSPEKTTLWDNLARGLPSRKRLSKHAAGCVKTQETDLSLLQSKAFKYLML